MYNRKMTNVVMISICSWNYFPQQTSDSFYLEKGEHYYFEVVTNQGFGPWSVGLSAKIHSLGQTTYPYQGDREEQRVEITSSTVRENIVSSYLAI